jgi:hypothetical protein
MIGQGRPSSLFIELLRAVRPRTSASFCARVAMASVLAIGLWLLCAMAAVPQVMLPGEPMRLRITWGGGEATRWVGQIAPDQGTLSDLHVANLNADAAGSIWLEEDGVKINSLSDHALDAIEVTARATSHSKLLIQLVAPVLPEPIQAEVPLSDLEREPFVLQLDGRGNSLKVELRVPDPLQIVADREQLIFAPSERFAFELRPSLPDVDPGTTLDIHTSLSSSRVNETLWSDHQSIAVPVERKPTLVVNVPLPTTEGVYTIRVAASQPPGFRERFLPGGAPPLATRSFEIVVIDSSSAPSTQPGAWEEILTIDPTNPRWWERSPAWPQLPRIPGLSRGPLGSTRATSIEHSLGRFIELPRTVAGNEPHWQAYSLPLEAPGAPHMLEIDYPADEPQSFSVSLLENNTSDPAQVVAASSGVYVEGLGLGEQTTHRTHKLVFWPRTQAPLLLITNQHSTAPARFGAIRVLKRTVDRLADGSSQTLQSDRLLAAYIAHPTNEGLHLGHSQPWSPAVQHASHPAGWQTLFRGTSRLVDYLQFAGFNGAVIAFPVELNRPAPPHNLDQETIPSTSELPGELSAPDHLELMLRAFAREQLTLVPALQLAAPLPELEALRRENNPQSSGLEWIGPHGQTWVARYGTHEGHAPYYNLLDLRVQAAILHRVSGFLDRYAQHPAMGGVAIQLSSHGYAQLPPLEWGMDDGTIARFERDSGLGIDGSHSNRFAGRYALLNSVNGQHAATWRAWRSQQVTEFYRRLAALVRSKNDHWRLILTTEQAFDHAELTSRVLPNIFREPNVDSTLLELGIDRQGLNAIPGVVLCPTHFVEPTAPLQEHAVQLAMNEAFAALRLSPGATVPGALLYHRPQRLALSTLAGKIPTPIGQDFQFSCQPVAHDVAAQQPYAMLLAESEGHTLLDGGACLTCGGEDTIRAARTIWQRLPASAEVEVTNQQPVVVKTYWEPSATTVLVINTCPWSTQARIKLNVTQPVALEPLAPSFAESAETLPAPAMIAPKGPPWALTLEPYGIRAVRISADRVKVAAVEAQVHSGARAEIKTRLAELGNRDIEPLIYAALANPGFEPIGAERVLPGWRLLAQPGVATVELDGTNPPEAATSLHVNSSGPLAVVESDPFPTPPTGQFAFTALLRGRNLAPHSEVRMVLQTDGERPAYYRFQSVGGRRPRTFAITDKWSAYSLLVNDLPLEPQQPLRVRFEFSGPGEWWVDDVKTYDLLVRLDFYRNQQQEWIAFQRFVDAARFHYKLNQITDCVRYMDSYWPRFYLAHTAARTRVARQPNPPDELKQNQPAATDSAESPGFTDKLWRLFRR